MAIIKITKTTKGYATIDCPPDVSPNFHHTSAQWDRERKAWLIETNTIDAVTRWLRSQGHLIVTDDDETSLPPAVEEILAALPPPDPGHTDIYARGARKARTAAAAARLAADQARRDWIGQHPTKHPWEPETNAHAMGAATEAANAIVDALELEENQP
jgi:hypothetical protein